jgi:hypothetical protein
VSFRKNNGGIGGTGISNEGSLHSGSHSRAAERGVKNIKRSIISPATLFKLVVSVGFLLWIYIIWNGASELDQHVKSMSDQSMAVYKLQVEYKQEIQEWKNVLLRSNNQQSLEENWQVFEVRHQSVAAKVREILKLYNDSKITDPIKMFASAHSANHIHYTNSKEALLKNGFDEISADAMVKKLDRPLLGYLDEAAEAIREEQHRINNQVVDKTRSQINQSLLILAFVALLVLWMPK